MYNISESILKWLSITVITRDITMTVPQPEKMHGTTKQDGIMAYGLAMNFT